MAEEPVMTDGGGGLAASTRAVILVVGLVGVVTVAIGAWATWAVLSLLADPLLWFLGVVIVPVIVGGVVHLAAALPSLVSFYRRFWTADPSTYWAGFVPGVALLAPAVALLVVGGPAALWLSFAAPGVAIVLLLLHPATRRDFGH